MATRMLFAMVGGEFDYYQAFLAQMDPAVKLALSPRHLMTFIHSTTGMHSAPYNCPCVCSCVENGQMFCSP